MDPVCIAIIMFALVVAGVLLGIHIGLMLLAAGVLGIGLITNDIEIALKMFGTLPFYATFDYVLSVIPLFILMGLFVNNTGVTENLYNAANLWLGNIRGGLAIGTVLANGVFAAISGISIASAAMFSKVALPQMLRLGYNKKLSLGTIAGSSVLGMLIPPSVLLIVYGVISEESIGQLFIAGVLPGILLILVYALGIGLMGFIRPDIEGEKKEIDVTWGLRVKSIYKCGGALVLIAIVLGGIYFGVFTPTEAGGVGVIGALVYMMISKRSNKETLMVSLRETGLMTGSFFLLLIGAQMFGRMLATSGLINSLAEWVVTLSAPPLLIVGLMLLIMVAMGTFLDCISIMIIMIPLVLPTIKALGLDPIWFGIISVLAIETGLITPPFGMVSFTIKVAIGDLATLEEIFAGSLPFFFMMILTIIILMFVPGISTVLVQGM